MSEFKRERRYLVAKVRDVETALSDDEKRQLSALMERVEHHREQQGKSPLECVVVESDWPNFQETWDSVREVWETNQGKA